MTDAERRRLAAGAGLVSQARLVGGLLNMLVIVCLTRLLPKPEFAVVAFVYMVQETANALGPLGLPSAVSFFVPRLGPRVRSGRRAERGNDVSRAAAVELAVTVAVPLPFDRRRAVGQNGRYN